MQFSFKINNPDVDLDALEKTWIEFIQNNNKPLFMASGEDWEIVSWSTDMNKWDAAKHSATIVDFEELKNE